MPKIPFSRFQDCFLDYQKAFIAAECVYLARKADLVKACQSLVSHPESTQTYKSEMLRFIRRLTSECS